MALRVRKGKGRDRLREVPAAVSRTPTYGGSVRIGWGRFPAVWKSTDMGPRSVLLVGLGNDVTAESLTTLTAMCQQRSVLIGRGSIWQLSW